MFVAIDAENACKQPQEKFTKTTYYCTKYVVPLQQITNRRSNAVTDETSESEYNKI